MVTVLGVHSTRIVAGDWRTAMMARLGGTTWKGLYALLSAVGLGLIVWGFGMVRKQPVEMWWPPSFMRHVAWLLTLADFVLLAAA